MATLQPSLDSFEWWLEFWTLMVVVGLVVEYAAPIIKIISARPFRWALLREVVGGLLITAGVLGELIVGARVSTVSSDLRSANGQLIALLQKQADEDELKIQQAKESAERERLERIKLEAIVAPRSLSLDQQRKIIVALRRFSSHSAVRLSSYGLDGEGAALGGQIISVLRSAGIPVNDERAPFIATGGFELGVHIRGPPTERDFISGLETAVSSIGKLQVFVNGSSFRPGVTQGGKATMSGKAIIGGGGGIVDVPIPATGPVSIMVGVKPVPVLPIPNDSK